MCPRCALRLMPITAEECFEGHAGGRSRAIYGVGLSVDYVLVIPPDMNAADVLVAK